jgi:hypothetical protein
VAKDKGKRRLTQSRSVAGFKPFTLERRTDDDLPQHIKGVAVWKEIEDEEGYWVFDILSNTYLAIEYEEATRQWYFIRQDSRTNNWVAVDTVPSTYGLGRSVYPVTTVAVDADDTEATSGQYQSSYFKPGNIQSSAMTSTVTTAAAALTLANTSVPSRLAQNFFSRRPGGGPPVLRFVSDWSCSARLTRGLPSRLFPPISRTFLALDVSCLVSCHVSCHVLCYALL